MFEVVKLNGEFVVVTQDHTKVLIGADPTSMPSTDSFCTLVEAIEIVDGEPNWKREFTPKCFATYEEATVCVKSLNGFVSIKTAVTFLPAQ